jgi:hypothetical protein
MNTKIVIIRKYAIHATNVYQVKKEPANRNSHARKPTEKSFIYVVASDMTWIVVGTYQWKYESFVR